MDGLKLLAAVMSLVVLAIFVLVFAYVVWKPNGASNEAITYIWTGVSVLVGGIVAVAYGQPQPKPLVAKITPEQIVLIYAWTYMAVGIVAVVVWAMRQGNTPHLVANAATTFLGLLLPIVSTFLRSK